MNKGTIHATSETKRRMKWHLKGVKTSEGQICLTKSVMRWKDHYHYRHNMDGSYVSFR